MSIKILNYVLNGIYMYKGVIFVCLFVCLIITQKPLDLFVLNFVWGARENHGSVLSLILRFQDKHILIWLILSNIDGGRVPSPTSQGLLIKKIYLYIINGQGVRDNFKKVYMQCMFSCQIGDKSHRNVKFVYFFFIPGFIVSTIFQNFYIVNIIIIIFILFSFGISSVFIQFL